MATIEIPIVIGCRLGRIYCTQKLLAKKYIGVKSLTYDSFKELLSKIPKNIVIHFSGIAKPFLNLQTVEMKMYSISSGYRIAVFTTLNDFFWKGIDITSSLNDENIRNLVVNVYRHNFPVKYKLTPFYFITK